VILFSALAVLSLFFVRRTATEAAVFRAWGYPWAPAIFSLVGFAIVVNTSSGTACRRSPAWP
jgi:hypothetical protein